MHAVIQRLVLQDPTRRDELVRRFSEGILRELAADRDTVGSQLIVGGDHTIVCIALFEGRAGAETGAVLIDAWTQRTIAPLVVGDPDIVLGEVVCE